MEKHVYQPYCVQIKNLGFNTQKAILFGNNLYVSSKNYGSDSFIEIKNVQSARDNGYELLIRQSAHEPFSVGKIEVSNTDNSSSFPIERCSGIHIDANGNELSVPVTFTLVPKEDKIIFLANNKINAIDGNTYIHIDLKARTSIEIRIYPSKIWK